MFLTIGRRSWAHMAKVSPEGLSPSLPSRLLQLYITGRTSSLDRPAAPELQYTFPVTNGTYLVRLHFAENFRANLAPGRRAFDVDINGVNVIQNLDVFASV